MPLAPPGPVTLGGFSGPGRPRQAVRLLEISMLIQCKHRKWGGQAAGVPGWGRQLLTDEPLAKLPLLGHLLPMAS